MKLYCINDRNSIGFKSIHVTKGRWYKAFDIGTFTNMIYIVSDNGTHPAVERSKFITLEEYRSNKIDEILK